MKVFFLTPKINREENKAEVTIEGRDDKIEPFPNQFGPAHKLDYSILEALEEGLEIIEERCGPIVSVVKTDKLITGEMFKEKTIYQFLVFARKHKQIPSKRR